jgi:hypothetical protein
MVGPTAKEAAGLCHCNHYGANPVSFYSDGRLFSKKPFTALPVSEAIKNELTDHPDKKGDTTGCGDNFCGGVIASLATQIVERKKNKTDFRGALDLVDAVAWGVASGGLACFYLGGTFFEQHAGPKKQAVYKYYRAYKKQIAKR